MRFLQTAALACSLLAPLAAQEKKAKAGLQVKLLAELVPNDLGQVVLTKGDWKSEPVDLPTNELSEPVAVTERELILKTVGKSLSLAKITLPEQGKAFAVVLVSAKPAGYKPIVVRTDDPAFKAGDVFFINRSGKLILAKLGSTALALKPGETAKSRPSDPKENAYYDIAFATRDKTGDNLISTTRWPIDHLLRSYVFFFTDTRGKVTYRAVDEYLPAPPAKKP